MPVTPFNDVVGKGAIVAPAQTGATAANAGVVVGLTVMLKVVDDAHCPASGVKV